MLKSQITVSARNQRISPKKARLVIDQIRSKKVTQAMDYLTFADKKAAKLVRDLLKSAISAAKDKDLKAEELEVSEAVCLEGKKLKRSHPNARGRVNVYQKRMSHFRISLAQSTTSKTPAKKTDKIEKDQNGSKS